MEVNIETEDFLVVTILVRALTEGNVRYEALYKIMNIELDYYTDNLGIKYKIL